MGAWLQSAGVADPGEDRDLPSIPDSGVDLPPLSLEWLGEVAEADQAQADWQERQRRRQEAAMRNGH